MAATPVAPDLAALLASWTVHLRAERKSPQTVKSYTAGVWTGAPRKAPRRY